MVTSVQGRPGASAPRLSPRSPRASRHTEQGFRDQQVVDEVEVLRQT
jgi:hypothetical protein